MKRDGRDLTSHVTGFCRALRARGLLVGPRETADAMLALSIVDLMDRGRVYWTLRGVLLSRREEIALFDELFESFWSFEAQPPPMPTLPGRSRAGGMKELRRRRRSLLQPDDDRPARETTLEIFRDGASPTEVISERELTAMRSDESDEIARIAARMVRALAVRPGRRRRRHRRKGAMDLRGALRAGLGTGGEPVSLPRLRRVPRVPRLLLLLDVSGSMDRYARLMLQLVYAVSQHTKRVEVFVFSTTLTRVTRELKAVSFDELLRRVGRIVDHWSGGTLIGDCLRRLNADYATLQDRHTTVFVLSDGWEAGSPDTLAREMRRLRRRVRSVVWLNPLLGTRDYEPSTRGLRAALPHVDRFASARDIAHLKRLPELLRG